ncbi:MAG: UbiH/UbiF family hydroxylase [Rhizobiaceae bacterium]
MKQSVQVDVLVAGNGPVGKIAALALANAGFSIAIAAPKAPDRDHRTTALMMPSIKFLKELGVWDLVALKAAPLRSMRIIDDTNHLIRAPIVTFNATEIEEEAFGWNMPNADLNEALDVKINANSAITLFDEPVARYTINTESVHASLSDETQISARLIAGADGKNSLARTAAGVKTTNWNYPQTAFVTSFEHRLPHEDMSTEFHTQSGPCVQVPLPGKRSSLVWVVAPEKAERLMTLNDNVLSWEIEQQLFSILGKVTVGPHRQSYPLSGQYPEKFGQNRIALLGEAAHVFPPIGAQGLNLGIRDVEDLRDVTVTNPIDPGGIAVLEAFNRKRRPDIMARVGAVDALNRSLISSMLPAQFARAFGLAILDIAPPLRGLFMREGMRPGAGFGSIFERIQMTLRERRP